MSVDYVTIDYEKLYDKLYGDVVVLLTQNKRRHQITGESMSADELLSQWDLLRTTLDKIVSGK